jgi:hypothetical protein
LSIEILTAIIERAFFLCGHADEESCAVMLRMMDLMKPTAREGGHA